MQSGPAIPADDSVAARRRLYDIVTHSAEETAALVRELARIMAPPCVVLMQGELGSGKTVLTKGIVAGLGAAPETEVTSPTFALVHEYAGAKKVYHIDLYRIEGTHDLATLGLDEILAEDATVIVEWGEKLQPDPRTPRFEVYLEHCGEKTRHIVVFQIDSSDD
jgi:tRNA threonylcarbamoyladenosine biosynthesis protein TsaE